MAITQRQVVTQRNILEDGEIQVRIDTIIEDDGVEIARSYWREVVLPGQDVSGKDASIQSAAACEHTPERVAAYMAKHADD